MDNMNKHLYNWLDNAEGKPKNTTNNNIKKETERQNYLFESVDKTIKRIKNTPFDNRYN